MIYKTILLVSFVLFSFFCVFQKAISEKANNNKSSLKDSIYNYFKEVSVGDYIFRVETICLNDSTQRGQAVYFNPIVVEQNLLFLYKNKVVKKFGSFSFKTVQKDERDKNIIMLENVLTDIGIIKTSDDFLFASYGGGGCNSCSEFFGVFSKTGDVLFYSYGSTSKDIGVFGNYDSIKTKYGLMADDPLSGTYKSVEIYR